MFPVPLGSRVVTRIFHGYIPPPPPPSSQDAERSSRQCVQCDGWLAGPALSEIILRPGPGPATAHAIALSTPGCSQLHYAAVFFRPPTSSGLHHSVSLAVEASPSCAAKDRAGRGSFILPPPEGVSRQRTVFRRAPARARTRMLTIPARSRL